MSLLLGKEGNPWERQIPQEPDPTSKPDTANEDNPNTAPEEDPLFTGTEFTQEIQEEIEAILNGHKQQEPDPTATDPNVITDVTPRFDPRHDDIPEVPVEDVILPSSRDLTGQRKQLDAEIAAEEAKIRAEQPQAFTEKTTNWQGEETDGMDFASLERKKRGPKPKEEAQAKSINHLNIEHELLSQYYAAKTLLKDNHDAPLNQQAQTTTAVVNILAKIIQLKTDIYNAERIKLVEGCLIEALKKFPNINEEFMKVYEATVKKNVKD